MVADLRGTWDFAFLGDVDPDGVDPAAIRFDDRMPVPGCFDATPAYAGRRGLAAYRTRAVLMDGTPHRLYLDGLHHWGRVFVGGRRLGDHVGGFTRFGLDITGHKPGETEIVVLADNRLDYARCPLHLEYFDWYHYGGIARGAELHRLGEAWIERVRCVTTDWRRGAVALSVEFRHADGEAPPLDLAITCDGRRVLREQLSPEDAAAGRIERTLDLAGLAPWSPGEPNLHILHVRLGLDDRRERIGIRQVRTEGRQILVNDRPVRLLGFNRHDAHPQFGHAVPEMIQAADVQILRDMGCNFVRGSHYPQDARFLDLCDEVGLCVWSESIGWQQQPGHLADEHYLRAAETNLDEMVEEAINHPSVILWGVLNEGDSHKPESRPGYERLLGRLRRLDPSRPVTFASNHVWDDVCLDLADVISVNDYPGWYHLSIEEIPAHLQRIVERLEAKGFGDRPLILSEIGAAAVYGWRDWHGDRWSEAYQARLLETVIPALFEASDRWCGLAIWQFCDGRTTSFRQTVMTRARGYNNKGVLDEYRRPKQAYESVKRLFRGLREP